MNLAVATLSQADGKHVLVVVNVNNFVEPAARGAARLSAARGSFGVGSRAFTLRFEGGGEGLCVVDDDDGPSELVFELLCSGERLLARNEPIAAVREDRHLPRLRQLEQDMTRDAEVSDHLDEIALRVEPGELERSPFETNETAAVLVEPSAVSGENGQAGSQLGFGHHEGSLHLELARERASDLPR
ncbi:MAG: hypothetical protein KIT84_00375 [Labilithrix sp.]|nr:hypothetical protein [Labilithrix sp.]MCW5809438.1 hypothetical protein [Labilithrix sp.]